MQIGVTQGKRDRANRELAAVDRLLARVANLAVTIDGFYDDSSEDVALLGIDIKSLVVLEADTKALDALRAQIAGRSDALATAVDPHDEASLVHQRAAASEKADTERQRLDEPTRRYEEYRHGLAVWKRRREEILGSKDVAESLNGLTAQLEAIDKVPALLEEQYRQRTDLMRQVFCVKDDLLSDYRRLYHPVQRFINEHDVAKEMDDALTFSASIVVDGLVDGLLAMIHQGRSGLFQGDQEGRANLEAIVNRHEFSTAHGVEAFTADLLKALVGDGKDLPKATSLQKQLLQSVAPAQVYNFVCGLGYLQPRFGLLWRGKPLDQLSPGERGTLLLVFFLLIDRRDVPLIIDQPEENLDNETIASLLVPAIKYAKSRRQVIIVTQSQSRCCV